MARVADKRPQTSYTGLQKSLHLEWTFVKRVTLDIGTAFQPVEDEMCDAFLPELLKGGTPRIIGRSATGIPVKQAGIALPGPT